VTAISASRNGNGIAGFYSGVSDTGVWIASALNAGQQISSRLDFNGWIMADRQRPAVSQSLQWKCFGPWNNVRNRYLGLRQQFHLGWARFNESCNRKGRRGTGAKLLLTGYAYETILNKPIIAGKTKGPDVITLQRGSLGRLAQGSAGRLGR